MDQFKEVDDVDDNDDDDDGDDGNLGAGASLGFSEEDIEFSDDGNVDFFLYKSQAVD